jgi:hypothetical protein
MWFQEAVDYGIGINSLVGTGGGTVVF